MSQPIRILQCIPGSMECGGIENFIMNIYRNIDRNKVQFDFLIHGKGKNYYEEEIKQLGGTIYQVPFPKDYKNYKKQMEKVLTENEEKYQTIHIHASYAISYLDAKIAKKCHLKNIIIHSHSANNNITKRKIVHYLLKSKLRKEANYRLACSKEAANWMFSKAEYKKINNAIDTNRYQFEVDVRKKIRREMGLEEKFVIGHIGRLAPAKNHIFLLEIFKEIIKLEEEAVLVIVGEGELKEQIKQKAERLGILDKVIFVGNSKNPEEWLQAMDAFVFPSLFEGFGLAALEAQCAGLPCFVSNNITKEINVTNLVEFISLNETPRYWAKRILDKKGNKRENKKELVQMKKYDILDLTKEMEAFYQKIEKE